MRNIDLKPVNLDFLGQVWKNQVAPAQTTAHQIDCFINKTCIDCKKNHQGKTNWFEDVKSWIPRASLEESKGPSCTCSKSPILLELLFTKHIVKQKTLVCKKSYKGEKN